MSNTPSVQSASKEVLDQFKELGLTQIESRIYISLLALGPSNAREISKKSGLRREDVYRTLHIMKSIGIVEIIMNNPFIFVAVDPKLALNILVSELEARLTITRKNALALAGYLGAIQRSDRAKNYYDSQQSVFKLEGGSQIFEQMARSVSTCKFEILRALTLTGISHNYNRGIVDKERELVKSRGVRIRVITEIDEEQADLGLLEDYSKIAEIRHLEGIGSDLKFLIIDNTEIIFFTTNPNRNVRELGAIWTNNKHLIGGFRIDFEKSWKLSTPITAESFKKGLNIKRNIGVPAVGGGVIHN